MQVYKANKLALNIKSDKNITLSFMGIYELKNISDRAWYARKYGPVHIYTPVV